MLSLPLEVRRAILREVDSKRDLCAVARVSRLMRIEAEWFIYRELDLGKRESARTVVAILKYILSSPVLPLYVRSFILTGVLQKETEYRLVAIFHLFSLVLQRMTRLRSLVIKLYPSPQINIFRRCTFKLSVLDVNYLDGPLVRFLESQPRIRILGLVAGLAKIMPIIPPAFLPILAAVITTDENAALLVPGRPVTHVRLPLNNRPSLEYLALSSAPILALSACIYCHKKDDEPLDTMIRLGRVAPDLEALYIVLLVKQNRDVVETSSALMDSIGCQFKKLRHLELRLEPFTAADKEVNETMLPKLRDVCPSVRTLTFGSITKKRMWTWTWGQRLISQKQRPFSGIFWDKMTAVIGVP